MGKSLPVKPRIGVIGLKGLPAYGGAATAGENIIKRLKNDYEFVVYSVSSHTNSGFIPEGYRQKVFSALPFHKLNIALYYLRSAIHAVFRSQYDLIHLHHIDGAFILPLLRLKYKVVGTAHARTYINGKWPGYINILLKIEEWLFLHMSDCVTSVGMPLGKIYASRVNKQVHYIPNGIDTQFINIPRHPSRDKSYILFAAGRIIPIKGLHLLLNALHQVKSKQKLVVLGDLNQIPKYKEDILKLSIGLDVDFTGLVKNVEEKAQFIANASLFVFPSLSETMSIMLLEVASLHVPVICSDIAANKAIFNEEEMLFFRSGDTDDLAQKVREAISDPETMQAKAGKALKRLKNDYNWDAIVIQYKNLFEKMMYPGIM